MIEDLINNKISNLININRYSGQFINVPESDSDHVWLMCSIAFKVVPELNNHYNDESDKIDLKDVIYRIVMHDIDECITSDIPRLMKHYDSKITNEINRVSKEILLKEFSKEFVEEIDSAKDHTREGFIVKVLDVLQVVLKYINELENTGNNSVKNYVPFSISVIEDLRKDLWESEYDDIYKSYFDGLLKEFIEYSNKIFKLKKLSKLTSVYKK